jgi:hypothetical protein
MKLELRTSKSTVPVLKYTTAPKIESTISNVIA